MMESERGETRWRRRERSSSSERLTQREGERGESARERERAAGGQERQQAAGTESAGPPASSGDATHHQRERQRELPERSRQLRRPTHYPNPSEHAQLLGNIPPRMSPTPKSLAFAALQFALVVACSRTRVAASHSPRRALRSYRAVGSSQPQDSAALIRRRLSQKYHLHLAHRCCCCVI